MTSITKNPISYNGQLSHSQNPENLISDAIKLAQKEANDAESATREAKHSAKRNYQFVNQMQQSEKYNTLNSIGIGTDYSNQLGDVKELAGHNLAYASEAYLKADSANYAFDKIDRPEGALLKEIIANVEDQALTTLAYSKKSLQFASEQYFKASELLQSSNWGEFASPNYILKRVVTSAKENLDIAEKAYDESLEALASISKLYNLTKDSIQVVEPAVRPAVKGNSGFQKGLGKITDQSQIEAINDSITQLQKETLEAELISLKDFNNVKNDKKHHSKEMRLIQYADRMIAMGFKDEFRDALIKNSKKISDSYSTSQQAYSSLDYVNFHAHKIENPNDNGFRKSVENLYRSLEATLEKTRTNYIFAGNRHYAAENLLETIVFKNADSNFVYKTNLSIAEKSYESAKDTYEATIEAFEAVRDLEELTREKNTF